MSSPVTVMPATISNIHSPASCLAIEMLSSCVNGRIVTVFADVAREPAVVLFLCLRLPRNFSLFFLSVALAVFCRAVSADDLFEPEMDLIAEQDVVSSVVTMMAGMNDFRFIE